MAERREKGEDAVIFEGKVVLRDEVRKLRKETSISNIDISVGKKSNDEQGKRVLKESREHVCLNEDNGEGKEIQNRKKEIRAAEKRIDRTGETVSKKKMMFNPNFSENLNKYPQI